MLAKYQILISKDDRHILFVDDDGEIMPASLVLDVASVVGCVITVSNCNNQFDVVDYRNVNSDSRFSDREYRILIGLNVE